MNKLSRNKQGLKASLYFSVSFSVSRAISSVFLPPSLGTWAYREGFRTRPLLSETERWLRKAKRCASLPCYLQGSLSLWCGCFLKFIFVRISLPSFISLYFYLRRPGVITMQALSEEDRRLWMEAMDGREPVSTIQGSRAGIKVLSCLLLP